MKFRLAWVATASLLLAMAPGCTPEQAHQSREEAVDLTPDPGDWSLHIAAHSSGAISRAADIRVRFVREQVEDRDVGREAEVSLRFEPPIEGVASWHTTRELRFMPAASLASGAKHRAFLELPGEGLPEGPFRFGFSVIRQDFEVRVEGLASDPEDPKRRILHGVVVTSDVATAEQVEKLLVATSEGRPREIVWLHAEDERHHRFSVADIRRAATPTSLQLRWDGSGIGVDSQGAREIEIPPLGVFKVTRAQAMGATRDHILVRFSDDLDPEQDLTGLVRVDGKEQRLAIDGNALKIFPKGELSGTVDVEIAAGVRNREGSALEQPVSLPVQVEARKPAVRFTGRGVILPDSERLTIPFEAVAVDSVQVTAFRVYEDNVGRFLQDNALDGQQQLNRVGRHLWRRTLDLDPAPGSGWGRYSLDATELLEKHRGSLFQLTLSIHRGNSTYVCAGADSSPPPAGEKPFANYDDLRTIDRSNWDQWEESANPVNWRNRHDPCKDAYYRFAKEARSSRNFLASNVGILAKRGETGTLEIVTTDLATAEPLEDVDLRLFNFQNQELATGRTGSEGFASIELDANPFYLIAERGDQRGYLKLSAGAALATSHFEVGGQQVRKGVKGHLYGERGVWRPGDRIHLTFVLYDPEESLPDAHPVTLTLLDPKGQRTLSVTNDAPVGDFYAFDLATAEDAPTGRWTAEARLGGLVFTKALRIETVMPNRLKAELDFGGADELHASAMPVDASVFGQWLHGADASGLRTDVRHRLAPTETRFARSADFAFDDPTRRFASELSTVFEGELDEAGFARFQMKLEVGERPPGKLSAHFTTRVFEESGAFSTERITLPFHPYERYVGIRTPPGDRRRGMLLTDQDLTVEVATLDANGDPVSLPSVTVRLYKLDWRWWWDQSSESLAQYASGTHRGLVKRGEISTVDGVGRWTFRIDQPEWGRFLIRACDREGGHCTGKIVYVDWPGWAGRAQEQGGIGATALSISSDRKKYAVGDVAQVALPAAHQGRALVGVETGSKISDWRWVDVKPGDNRVAIEITADMVPTAYVSAVLLQPHEGKENDLPIRLYGYLGLEVEDPTTHLAVQLDVPDEIRPEQSTRLEVAERDGRPMTYTVAIVDEGLLGLTNHATPDLHGAFYAREALGIRTWDVFDLVVGAYGGELERLLALGGGGALQPIEQQKKKRRFPPVVAFLGPFELEAGGRATHDFELPPYIGAVRVMVVAGRHGAYGKAEKSVFVRDRLMLLSTLPRVVGPGEDVSLPVSVFATHPEIRDVEVDVETDAHFEVRGASQTSLHFEKPGDQFTRFDLHVSESLGQGEVAVTARSGASQAKQEIAIDVRSPNRETLRQLHGVIETGQTWRAHAAPHGLEGTNQAALELSSVPPLNLERRLEFLVRYPYGCLEQTTSSVFPQLYLPSLASLDPDREDEIERNIETAIENLRGFQRADGSFTYWPGGPERHDWSTSYAGHFLVEASKQGYHVPVGMLPDWLHHQRSQAQSWVTGGASSSFEQAYRLYTLALAGEPEVGAMNRLREMTLDASATRWLLAAAYRLAGLPDAADAVVRDDTFRGGPYGTTSRTFGSRMRDEAIILMGLVTLGRMQETDRWVDVLSAKLASDRWHSTQSTAWSLLALSRYVGDSGTDPGFAARVKLGGAQARTHDSKAALARIPLAALPSEGTELTVENSSQRRLYATLSVRGVPRAGEEQASTSDMRIDVRYTDVAGEPIDVARIEQGRDFLAHVTVHNTTDRPHENLALAHVVASGWEIHDPRFEGESQQKMGEIDFQDVRDDRVYTYFPLKGGEKKAFRLLLNAAYRGRYYLPPVSVEAMYDASVNARTSGRWIEVSGRADR
jgi:uncharacterized protein YfaS (alpha-2-macroglobulin family)